MLPKLVVSRHTRKDLCYLLLNLSECANFRNQTEPDRVTVSPDFGTLSHNYKGC